MVKWSYPFQQFLVVELSYKVNVCCYFTNVSNIALSTCLWPISVVLEKIQAAKINHLCVKLKYLFQTKPYNFQLTILLEDIHQNFLPDLLPIQYTLLHPIL